MSPAPAGTVTLIVTATAPAAVFDDEPPDEESGPTARATRTTVPVNGATPVTETATWAPTWTRRRRSALTWAVTTGVAEVADSTGRSGATVVPTAAWTS